MLVESNRMLQKNGIPTSLLYPFRLTDSRCDAFHKYSAELKLPVFPSLVIINI